jgi:cytosine/adenosine deaminase-related metal-dependent hydrolase
MRILIENADYVITLDRERRILKNASIVIEDSRITDVGKTANIKTRYEKRTFDKIIKADKKVVMPGFVDAHVHLSEHISRSLFPDNLSLGSWLSDWKHPYSASLTEEDQYISALLGCIDMIKTGTTCFIEQGSIGPVDPLARAVEETGIRGILGRSVMDRILSKHGLTPDDINKLYYSSADEAIRDIEKDINKWNGKVNDRIRAWVIINGKHTCTDELYVKAKELARRMGVGIHCHMASTIEEARFFEKEKGEWPITHLDRIGFLGPNVLLAHALAVKDEEVEILKRNDTKVCHCPGTALKTAKGTTVMGKFPEMIEAGVTVALGCDGTSAAGSFDMVRQMYLAAGLYKDCRMNPNLIPAEAAVEMATINGAKALLWDKEIGSIEVGKKADLILFDTNRPEWRPLNNVLINLVYSASGDSVDTVIIDGNVVMENRVVKNVDEQEVLEMAQKMSWEIAKRSKFKSTLRWPLV